MRFNKIVLYDLKSKPLDKVFITRLKKFTKFLKIVLVDKEYSGKLNNKHLEGADALILRIFDFYEDLIFEKSNLRYIGSMHTDISHFNLDILKKKKITLTNVPGYSTEAVAELTISALLNIFRQTHDAMNFVKKGNWGFENFMGRELQGKILGIIGLGRIGSRVAELAQCFGMKVVYYSPNRKLIAEKKGIKFLRLNSLLKQSDAISLHCTLNEQTKNILDKFNLKYLKEDAVLLNSARCELVDLDALYKICQKGKIKIWFEAIEEKKVRNKFRKLGNIYLTPHFGWMTKEAQERLKGVTIENIESYFKGSKLNKIV